MAAHHEQPYSEDEVPTLNDLIFPGNPEKIKQKTTPVPSVKDQINALPREGIQTIKPKPKKNSLEKMIAEHNYQIAMQQYLSRPPKVLKAPDEKLPARKELYDRKALR